ncbi:hypothetical protein M0804_012814 [Polistes exclamans]|nr:hypothetical protein M0804_012814 [Polistes exclamans]
MQSEKHAVSLFIGADILGKLFTGRYHQLKNGLVAIETRLGWAILGKVPTREQHNDEIADVVVNRIPNAI